MEKQLAVAAVIAFAASEIIGLNPKWRANSVIQLILLLVTNALAPYDPEHRRPRR